MPDIEFNCPECSTPLVVACESAGRIVTCPRCSKRIEVPGRCRVEVADVGPPIAPGHRQDYRDYDLGITLRTRNCTLAYVSLALVCLSFITGLLLLLPGLVCGHIAIVQCNRDPNMTGKTCAVAALVIGYIVVSAVALFVLGIGVMMSIA